MATKPLASQNLTNPYQVVEVATWEGLATGDDGSPLRAPGLPQKVVQVKGTFGGATCVIEGSNDNVTYVTLNDVDGAPLSFAAAGMKGIKESPLYLRPKVTGGAAVDIDVILVAAK